MKEAKSPTINSVELLSKPASTLIEFAFIGRVANQSANKSTDRFLSLISSLIRILNSNRGYSGSCIEDNEVVDDAFRS